MKKLESSFAVPIFLVFVVLPLSFSVTGDLNSDRQALLDFSAIVGHTRKLNWNATNPVCTSWHGITCNPNKTNVIAIHLPGFGLFGSIPANSSIGKLDALRVLSLHSNFLYGSLPSDVTSIPSLKFLYLQHNNLSGVLPASLSPNLIVLDLSSNSFSGHIPASIQNLTRLTVLSLQNNSISGAIPNLNSPSLKVFNLSYNNFNGSIPYALKKYPDSSFIGNPQLCGAPLNNCSDSETSSSPSPSPTYLTVPKDHHSTTFLKKLGPGPIIAVTLGGSAVLVLVVLITVICCCKRSSKVRGGILKGKASGDGKELPIDFGSGVQEAEKNKLFFFEGCYYNFDLEDLLRASAEVLGKGSFGTTYKAVLDEETTVAVKRLREVVVGKREFEQHMEVVARVVKHPNVVPPRAYYYSKDEKLLVYSYMPAGSLFAHLHGSKDSERPTLDWNSRVKISLGIAKGIAYIHSEGGVKCNHGNIKSTNVLLTEELEACLIDIGLSPLMNFPPPMPRANGYCAPEATDMRKVTQKSDVYSFGVLLLEMLTGKTTLPYLGHDSVVDLPRWVKSVVREEWTAEVFDVELLRQQHNEEEMVQMLQIALTCVSKLPETRPNMDEVVRMIEEIRQSDTKTRPSSESQFDVQQQPTP